MIHTAPEPQSACSMLELHVLIMFAGLLRHDVRPLSPSISLAPHYKGVCSCRFAGTDFSCGLHWQAHRAHFGHT